MADGMLSLSWNNHKATFCHILSTLREKERYTDVTVACEGKFYPVHKLVLSTCSEYFEKIFENTPCKHPVIVLKDVNRSDLEALFCYMYEGAVSVAQSNLGRLIKAAEVLRIKGLAVPDEPPISESGGKRSGYHSHHTDDRSSPHPKRRRREDSYNTRSSGGQHATSPSPSQSPRASPSRSEGDTPQSSRSKSDSAWSNQRHGDEQTSDQLDDRPDNRTSRSSPTPPQVEVTVDESLVKEELVEQGEEGPEDVMDSGMDYGSVGSDSRLDGSAGGGEDDPTGHLMPNKYEQKINPQSQALPEAVVEALAGPSGMQGWLGGCEMPSGFSGLEGYGGEGSQDLHSQVPGSQPQAHQMVIESYWSEHIEEENRPEPDPVTAQDLPATSCPDIRSLVDVLPPDKYKFVCNICPFRSHCKSGLTIHMRRHTGEKHFPCPHCPKTFARASIRKQHIHTHTGEKPFVCPVCSKRFIQKSSLKSHLRTHTPFIWNLKEIRSLESHLVTPQTSSSSPPPSSSSSSSETKL